MGVLLDQRKFETGADGITQGSETRHEVSTSALGAALVGSVKSGFIFPRTVIQTLEGGFPEAGELRPKQEMRVPSQDSTTWMLPGTSSHETAPEMTTQTDTYQVEASGEADPTHVPGSDPGDAGAGQNDGGRQQRIQPQPTETVVVAGAVEVGLPDRLPEWARDGAVERAQPATVSWDEPGVSPSKPDNAQSMMALMATSASTTDLPTLPGCGCPCCNWTGDGNGDIYSDPATQTNPSPGNTLIAGLVGPNKWTETPEPVLTWAMSDGSSTDWDHWVDNGAAFTSEGSSATHANLESGTGNGNNLVELRSDIRYAFDLFEAWFELSFLESSSFDGSDTDLKLMTFTDYSAFGRAVSPQTRNRRQAPPRSTRHSSTWE
ncbi:hypothetical protein AB9K41_00645, partial [Cribrihabitans sp. XS_ASV171]